MTAVRVAEWRRMPGSRLSFAASIMSRSSAGTAATAVTCDAMAASMRRAETPRCRLKLPSPLMQTRAAMSIIVPRTCFW